jgi:hypothetical protein
LSKEFRWDVGMVLSIHEPEANPDEGRIGSKPLASNFFNSAPGGPIARGAMAALRRFADRQEVPKIFQICIKKVLYKRICNFMKLK